MGTIQDFIQYNYFVVTALLFVLGACVGSFLNVCILRLPEEKESIVKPRSRCPQCKTPLRWYDNIPILGYIILQRRCRYCKERISPQYIIVEVLTGYLFVQFFNIFGLSSYYGAYLFLTCALLVATVVDFRHQIIPDEINFTGIIVGLILSTLFPQLQGKEHFLAGFGFSLLGLLAGGGIIYVTGMIGDLVFKKESMGGGDVKLMAMIGAFLGWKYALLTYFVAPFLGSVVGLYVKFVEKKETIPYGPFLSMAALIVLFWGDLILRKIFGL